MNNEFCNHIYECPNRQQHLDEGRTYFEDSNCGYRPFYDKFGVNYLPKTEPRDSEDLGIGAMVESDLRRLG